MFVMTFKRSGHCNFDDVAKLEKVVEGISIKGKHDMSNRDYEIYTQGKFAQSRNSQADAKATTVLDLVQRDLCGPIEPADNTGFAISFTDDYSGMIFP